MIKQAEMKDTKYIEEIMSDAVDCLHRIGTGLCLCRRRGKAWSIWGVILWRTREIVIQAETL